MLLDELGQHAPARPRVHKRDAMAAESTAGDRVDEIRATRDEGGEGRIDIAYGVGDVVKPRAATLEKARDTAPGVNRCDELDLACADVERGRLDALVGEHLSNREARAEALLILDNRGVEVGHGNADVMNPLETHGAGV
jgi:hypothetical protein